MCVNDWKREHDGIVVDFSVLFVDVMAILPAAVVIV